MFWDRFAQRIWKKNRLDLTGQFTSKLLIDRSCGGKEWFVDDACRIGLVG
jgi:hypothetical protein